MRAMTIERKSGEDRISKLPDDVMCHILSFLTVKEATATSLLSTRWRFLWNMVLSLDIECSKPIMKFFGRVNTFLALRRTEKITRFRLKCNSHYCCSHYVEEWVSEVVARKVEQVNISLCMCHAIVLNFPALFTFTTIVALKLEGFFNLFLPSSVYLPNVKTLRLHLNTCVPFLNIRNLISGSPVLKLFHLKRYRYPLEEWKFVHNSLGIRISHVYQIHDLVVQSNRAYDIIPHYIESSRKHIVKSSKVYMTMYTGNKHFYMNQVVSSLLKEACNVEFLSLGDFRVDTDPSNLDLPHFKNLVELRLFLKNADSLFMKLPAKCPKLEVLEVNIMDDRYGINQRCRYRISGGARERDLSIVPFIDLKQT